MHLPIIVARGDGCAIGRPRHGFHLGGMAAIDEEELPRGGIPDLHRAIRACGGDPCPVG